MALFKKTNPLQKRIRNIDRELSLLDQDIDGLRKTAGRSLSEEDVPLLVSKTFQEPDRASRAEGPEHAGADDMASSRRDERPSTGGSSDRTGDGSDRDAPPKGKRAQDPRFADYLASSFQPVRPLRHERRIQRNKAILMTIFALVVLYWLIHMFFL